ncbi:MAG: hypothetical protein WA364_04265 [Candidatus Nitrosopolaris sp.]
MKKTVAEIHRRIMPPSIVPSWSAAIGGINCTIIVLFGVSLLTAEAPPPLTPNIPEPANPAKIIVSVMAVRQYHLHSSQLDESKLESPLSF